MAKQRVTYICERCDKPILTEGYWIKGMVQFIRKGMLQSAPSGSLIDTGTTDKAYCPICFTNVLLIPQSLTRVDTDAPRDPQVPTV